MIVVDRDDAHGDEKIDQEDHDGVDFGMHLVGQWVGHAGREAGVPDGYVDHLGEDGLRYRQQH